MKKVIVFVLLALLACGAVMAQSVTVDGVTFEYDAKALVLRISNTNKEITQIAATNGKTAIAGIIDANSAWEMPVKVAPKEGDLKIGKVTAMPKGKVAAPKGWTVAAIPAPPPPDPKAGGKAAPKAKS